MSKLGTELKNLASDMLARMKQETEECRDLAKSCNENINHATMLINKFENETPNAKNDQLKQVSKRCEWSKSLQIKMTNYEKLKENFDFLNAQKVDGVDDEVLDDAIYVNQRLLTKKLLELSDLCDVESKKKAEKRKKYIQMLETENKTLKAENELLKSKQDDQAETKPLAVECSEPSAESINVKIANYKEKISLLNAQQIDECSKQLGESITHVKSSSLDELYKEFEKTFIESLALKSLLNILAEIKLDVINDEKPDLIAKKCKKVYELFKSSFRD